MVAQKFDLSTAASAETQRGRVEEGAKAEKVKLKNFFEIIIDGIVVNDEKGEMIEVNKSMAQMFGFKSPQKMIGKTIFNNIAEREVPRISKLFEEARKKKEPEIRNLEVICRREDGSEFTVMFDICHQWDEDKYLGSISAARDISSRNRAEDELKKSEELLKNILNILPVRVFWKDAESRYLGCNELFAKDAGLPIDEIVGKNDFDLAWKKYANLYHNDDKKVIESGASKLSYEEQMTTPTGDVIWLSTSKVPFRDSEGKIIGVLGVYSNINDRKEAEQALKESEEKWRSLATTAPAVILTVNREGIIQFLNRTVGEYTPEGAIGASVYDYVRPGHRDMVRKSIEGVFRTGQPGGYEVSGAGAKGPDTAWYRTHLGPVIFRDKVIAVNLISMDITDRKNMEKALEEQKEALEQKNVALREIIGQIEVEKNKIKDDVEANVDEILLPIFKKLRLNGASRKYIDLLKHNLEKLTSAFGRKITQRRLNLTPREIEICNMIKGGITSKEISGLLGVSHQTIEKHRKNIRQKLRISNKNINLATFLQQF